MGNLQNQKSALAKLMATENLTVQHAKTYTASFDPKNRILTIPIWEKTSAELYDLLVGHEVGHAIDTPADGWHGAVHNNGRNYRAFLNVVEDARIEKRQKRRYPGLRRSFVIGFEELMGRDFFGLEGRDINGMSFIDRLNVYTKSGYTMNTIKFKNEKEEDFVERTKHLETWDDVLKLTNEIWDYSKDEQFELNLPEDYEIQIEVQMDGDAADADGDGGGDGEEYSFGDDGDGGGDDDSDTETDGEGNQKAKANGDSKEGGDGDSSGSSKKETKDGEEKDGKEKSQSINRQKESKSIKGGQEPRCETDDNYRRNEMLLVDKNAKDYIYVSPPTPVMNKIITPVKRVQQLLTQEFSDQNDKYEKIADRLYSEYRRRNERFISLLAKEFEMRKAASKFSKSKTSETGDLDVGKIFKYQIDDNIFKRIMKVPKGKSHGLVLLLDKSGSMSDNLSASYEQILILASFCRKVNIPFTAYGFGNEDGVYELDNGKQLRSETNFSAKAGEIRLRKVYLREMINSKMGIGEFNKAMKNILCLAEAWKRGYYGANGNLLCVPQSDSLSNTPLNEALVAIQQVLNDFRTQNKLDIVNLCIVHDGDADDTSTYIKSDLSNAWMTVRHDNIVLVDKKNRIQIPLVHGNEPMRVALCDWLTRTTGAKVIGFFIAPVGSLRSSLRRRLYNEEMEKAVADSKRRKNEDAINEVLTKYSRIVRKEKFVESKNPGYESFFILPGDNDMSVTDEEFETDSNTTAGLSRDFAKFNKARQVSRVLVNRFIGMIAV